MKKLFSNLLFRLLLGLIAGILIGYWASEGLIQVLQSIRHILGQLIMWCVPLIIIGFITPAIISLRESAGKILTRALIICYLSSVGAALFALFAGRLIIPALNIKDHTEGGKALPDMVFQLNIPAIMPVMTALVLAVLFGLAVIATKSKTMTSLFDEMNRVVLFIINFAIIRILPFFICASFACLAYEGDIIYELPIFISIIGIVLVGHFIWLTLLYGLGGAFSGKNPLNVLRYYVPAYMTAVGTMSSAATLPVSLRCARKSPVLEPEIRDFAIPLCANTHLCGSVLTETFFVMTVSQILYHKLPSLGTMILFCLLLGIFAIAAPGVPGGTVVASLGLITGILHFDASGTALMLAIFALQDSFGTACNVTGDGAIALMLTGMFKRGYYNKNPEAAYAAADD